jgi:hypothetical protein
MFTEIYEGIFNKHPKVKRSALVGVGPRGNQRPIMILESDSPISELDLQPLREETEGGLNPPDGEIIVVDWPLPVDIRHNAKIDREKLAIWAAKNSKLRAHP